MLWALTLFLAISCTYGAPSTIQTRARMIDGSEVAIEDRPFQLSVWHLESYKCNAVIIGENWALTTAFCATSPSSDPEPEYFFLRAGSAKFDSGGTLHTVKRIVIHEHYSTENIVTPDFDIAVMRVASPFTFDATTQPCKLWGYDFPPPQSLFEVSGWNTQLVQTKVQLIDQRYCIAAYQGVIGSNITLNMFCAEQINEDSGPCNETDIGSPITADGRLIGVVAHPTCYSENMPTVYTNALMLRVWIFIHTGIVF